MKYAGLGHINIVVDDIKQALSYYQSLLGAVPIKCFPRFKNQGYAKAAGFLDNPEQVEASIAFMEIPDASLFIELTQYHWPKGRVIDQRTTHDFGGIGHLAIRVKDIDEWFDHVKSHQDTQLISDDPEYYPAMLTEITNDEFYFCDDNLEADEQAKQEVCDIVSSIRYFYFYDKYRVQWEFEQGHHDIG